MFLLGQSSSDQIYNPPCVSKILVTLQVVTASVHTLLGLNVLDTHQLIVDTAFNLLEKRPRLIHDDTSVIYVDKWIVTLYQDTNEQVGFQIGHRTAVRIFSTRYKLACLHRHFSSFICW